MTDEKIIDLFFQRDEQAIQMSMDTYDAYCRTVAAGILSNPADIDEAVADTYLAVWNAIPPHRPKCLRLFFGRIARNRSVSILRKNTADFRGGKNVLVALDELSQCVSTLGCPEQEIDARQLGEAISCFLKKQPLQQRQVFLQRYFYMEDISDIANRYGLQEANVRMILSRTRQKLHKYLKKEGYL